MSAWQATDLRERVSLKSLFERDNVELRKAGRDTWKCCCPFHVESTASCVVHEDKGFFKCFGCNARGTIFEYWAHRTGIDGKSKAGFADICRQLSELVLGHAVTAPRPRPATEVKEPDRPVPLAGRDLEKWKEGCAWLLANEAEQQTLADWRGYSVELVKRLAELGKLGMPKYFLSEREHGRLPALSVECLDEKTGQAYLAGWHVRIDPEPGEKHAMWHFVPKGIGSWPFVVGDPAKAAVVVILEGQWDAIAWIDAMGLGAPIKNTAVLGVRGAGAWEKTFVWSWNNDEAQVWLYADSDDAGMGWLHNEQALRGTCGAVARRSTRPISMARRTSTICTATRPAAIGSNGLQGCARWCAGNTSAESGPANTGRSASGPIEHSMTPSVAKPPKRAPLRAFAIQLPVTTYHEVDIPGDKQKEIAIRVIERACGLPCDAYIAPPRGLAPSHPSYVHRVLYTCEDDGHGGFDYTLHRIATPADKQAVALIQAVRELP